MANVNRLGALSKIRAAWRPALCR